jgi:hypothetical protein
MRSVVALLRENGAEALAELFELHIAISELTLNAHVLVAVAVELAKQTTEISASLECPPREQLQEVAKAAAKVSEVLDGQTKVLDQIQRGLDSWSITQAGLHLV